MSTLILADRSTLSDRLDPFGLPMSLADARALFELAMADAPTPLTDLDRSLGLTDGAFGIPTVDEMFPLCPAETTGICDLCGKPNAEGGHTHKACSDWELHGDEMMREAVARG